MNEAHIDWTGAVTTGDAAGVGPEVSLQAACVFLKNRPHCNLQIFGDRSALHKRLEEMDHGEELRRQGRLQCVHAADWDLKLCRAHAPSAELGAAQIQVLEAGTRAVREGRAHALVTAPMSKEAVVLSGTPFSGHTEHLAKLCGLDGEDVTMLFLGPRLKIALVTTHLAVSEVPGALSKERIVRSAKHLAEALCRLAVASNGREVVPQSEAAAPEVPRVFVAGLNPHAGEGGLFGREEIDIIRPACEVLPLQGLFASGKAHFAGLIPSEAAFRFVLDQQKSGVVAMMHDHATIASKLVDWGKAVNVTWGLPFVRTSVDHGVAYDAARAGKADHEGMLAALEMAYRLRMDTDRFA